MLVFDFNGGGGGRGTVPGTSLATGFIDPIEIKDFDVVVFVTHSDGDHYTRNIWNWKKTVKKITYVLGWEPQMPQEKYIRLKPWQEKGIGNIQVATAPSMDSGVAYLVKVDGLTICHSGDLAFHFKESEPVYRKAMEFFRLRGRPVDLLFMNGEPFSNPSRGIYFEKLDEGMYIAVERLEPITYEHLVRNLIKDAPTEEIGGKIVQIEKAGKVFIYRDGEIIPQ